MHGWMRQLHAVMLLTLILDLWAGHATCADCQVLKDIERDTATALQQLEDNQNPSDCSRARFLLCDHRRGGVGNFGSKSVALASCLGRALQLRAVAVQATGNMGVGRLADQLAPFKPWSKCTLEQALKVQSAEPDRVVVADFLNFPAAHEDSVNGVRRMSYESMPTRWRRRGPVWWKAVELKYMLRPTDETVAALAATKAALGWGSDVEGLMHSMHIRRGDKIGTEGHYYPFMYFLEALAWMTPPSSSPNVHLFVATDDRHAVSMETEPYAHVKARFSQPGMPQGYNGTAQPHDLSVALDILLLSEGHTQTFTGSSNFGVVSLYLNLLRRNFCLNFTTLDKFHPFWWGDETLHDGHVLELYDPVQDLSSPSPSPFVYAHVDFWRGRSDRFVGMGRGSYNPVINVDYDMSVYMTSKYAADTQTFLCLCSP